MPAHRIAYLCRELSVRHCVQQDEEFRRHLLCESRAAKPDHGTHRRRAPNLVRLSDSFVKVLLVGLASPPVEHLLESELLVRTTAVYSVTRSYTLMLIP